MALPANQSGLILLFPWLLLCAGSCLQGGEYANPSQTNFYHYRDMWMFSLKVGPPHCPVSGSSFPWREADVNDTLDE
jgi:hypothetical protein